MTEHICDGPDFMKTKFIVNPMAASGRAGKKWPYIETLVRLHFSGTIDIESTQYPLHAESICRVAINEGYNRIIAVGGDGTLNEAVNGFFEKDKIINESTTFGIIQVGTGADFTRNFNIPKKIEEQIERLGNAKPQKIDVGYAEFNDLNGKESHRVFLNILDFGMGGATVEYINKRFKKLGGWLSFQIGILRTLIVYKNKIMHYTIDGDTEGSKKLVNFVVANGKYFGSGLRVAPDAEINDGIFDIIFIGDFGRLEAVRNLPKLRRGMHLQHKKVECRQGREISAYSDETVFIDMDGEMVGVLPIKIKILPGALPFLIY